MEFTKQEFSNFRLDVKRCLKELEEKYNVVIGTGSISYDDVSFSLSLKVDKKDEKELRLNNLDVYGKKFKDGRYIYKVVDYKPNCKYNIVCEREDGKKFDFPYSYVKDIIGKN